MRAIAFACAAVVAVGCGSSDDTGISKLPSACAGNSGALMKALRAAPGRVLVDGRPISRCFTRNQDSAALQVLGTGLLETAQELGDRSRQGDQRAALRLGYLIGAARRGSARNNGLGSEIVRRLEAETMVGAARQAAYDRGLRAGLATG